MLNIFSSVKNSIWRTLFFFFGGRETMVLYLIISNFSLFSKDDKMERVNTMQQINGRFA